MSEKLDEALKAQIKIAEKNILDIESEISKAKRIGLDVVALESRLKSQKSQVALVKDVYGI